MKLKNIMKESYNNDKQYRDIALSLTSYIMNELINPSLELQAYEDFFMADISDDLHYIIPNYDNKKCFLIFNKNKHSSLLYSFSSSKDDFRTINFSILSGTPSELYDKFIDSHKKSLLSLINKNLDKDAVQLVDKKFKKYVKTKFLKPIYEKLLADMSPLLHECIHFLDDIRKTSTYKPYQQNIDSESGLKDYYNDDMEQNAYFQQTLYFFDIFKELSKQYRLKNKVYNSFKEFFKAFVSKYRGSYDHLTYKNKQRLAKRAYNYWVKEYKNHRYEDFHTSLMD